MEKQCSKCKSIKPISEIYTNGYCKICHSVYRKAQYNNNKKQIKDYNEKNKEKIVSYHKEYYANNKKLLNQKYLERRKQYYYDNKETKLAKQKEYKKRNVERYKNYQPRIFKEKRHTNEKIYY